MLATLIRLRNTLDERDDRGAALVEYGLLLSLVALVVMAIAATLGSTIAETFGFASDTLADSPALTAGS